MSQQYTSSSPATNPRRSSIASERTLVDASTLKSNAVEKEAKELNDDNTSTKSRGSTSSIPSLMSRAAKKVKAKLGEKDSTSQPKPKPKPKQQQPDMYPDTLYMWRALAETKI
ncbi:hypothetical protein GGS26DRAFT_550571 [Hypomontagnella submonticulosa]|nr:hypothetical protein GGS26DRAFT_550571 [Hypomontagnella submonticulosa]